MNTNTELPNTGLPYAEDAKITQRTQKEQPKVENDFSHEIIGAAVEVQRVLGVGLLESAYAGALAIELSERADCVSSGRFHAFPIVKGIQRLVNNL